MIFILGGSGFVGSAFVRYCVTHGLAHAALTRANYDHYAGQACRLLINAGGNSSKRLPLSDPLLDFDKNARDTLRSLLDFRAECYVLLSSIDVYRDHADPANNAETNAIVPEQLSRYGLSKYVGELMVHHYAPRHFVFRLGGMVGPGLRKNAIYDLTHGGRLFVHPESCYQYMHTDWLAETILELVEHQKPGQTINVCGDQPLALTSVMEWLGLSLPTIDLKVEQYQVNIDRLKAAVPVPDSLTSVRRYLAEINAT